MTDRNEHLKFCKERAMVYFNRGDLANAVTSMASDLGKHPDFCGGIYDILNQLGMIELMNGNRDGVRRWIEGFN